MAFTPPDPHFFTAADGVDLAWYEIGAGRPVVLLHGFMSDSATNWVRYGHADAVAAQGRRVIMLDFRAHGASDKPHDRAHYRPDILTDDARALIAHLGLVDYDLVGYSLGARTVSRLLATGAKPGRAVLAGMGLEGLTDVGRRAGHFRHILEHLGEHERGSAAWMVEAFLKTTNGDPQALLGVIDTFAGTSAATLATFTLPIQILCGVDDRDNGSAPDLVAALPNAVYAEVPGGHMSAVVKPELGAALAAFLAG